MVASSLLHGGVKSSDQPVISTRESTIEEPIRTDNVVENSSTRPLCMLI